MTKESKGWQKPELIVLARSKPEEAVLLACKENGNFSGPWTPGILNDWCQTQSPCGPNCNVSSAS